MARSRGARRPRSGWTFHAEREWIAGGFRVDGLRLPRRAHALRLALDQLAVRHRRHLRVPKDFFHYYRAWWRKAPALHLFPHWNWSGREGKEVSVWVHANVEEVELLVNGVSAGRKPMPRLGHLEWLVKYAPGAIEARGYNGGVLALSARRETTGAPAKIRLSADRMAIDADGEDVAMVRVEALDAQDRWVPVASDKLAFKVSGAGRLIGVGNGDPNCLESDQQPRRSLFNGLAQVIVRAGRQAGDIVIEAARDGEGPPLAPARLTVRARPVKARPAVG